MNKETRIKKIQEILKQDPTGSEKVVWKDKLESMPVHEVKLEYLVYNKYNGRILSKTKSFEKKSGDIDPETTGGKKLIEELLWESKESANEKTKIDLEKYGQKRVGIITRDGVIIDGNRRAMLLNRINKFDYFRAIVLDVTSTEDSLEIEKLETSYQMGEDEKLGYNATEKYLKTKEIYLRLTKSSQINLDKLNNEAIKKISDWMGESNSEIEKYMNTMVLMDEYLSYLEYDGIYTQLDSREDQFLSLTKWLNTFYNTESKKGFDGYDNTDVDDLKTIEYDNIAKDEFLESLPKENVFQLYRGGLRSRNLYKEGIIKIKDIPESQKLIDNQKIQRQCAITGKVNINKEKLKEFIDGLNYPLYYLDFETILPAIPKFDKTKPYQQIPFQYSLHILESPEAEFKHVEYLHRDSTNPIPNLLKKLKKDIGPKGSVLVWYKGFETKRNEEMAVMFPEFGKFLEDVNSRVVDLMEPFSNGWFVDKDFFGSASIKYVLPVVVPRLSYKELGIQEGASAQRLWMDAVLRNKAGLDKDKLFSDLVKYCKMDTLAMVEIWRYLNNLLTI